MTTPGEWAEEDWEGVLLSVCRHAAWIFNKQILFLLVSFRFFFFFFNGGSSIASSCLS